MQWLFGLEDFLSNFVLGSTFFNSLETCFKLQRRLEILQTWHCWSVRPSLPQQILPTLEGGGGEGEGDILPIPVMWPKQNTRKWQVWLLWEHEDFFLKKKTIFGKIRKKSLKESIKVLNYSWLLIWIFIINRIVDCCYVKTDMNV